MNSEPELCNVRMLARRLKRFGVTVSWLYEEAEAGRLPALRIGKRYLFNAEAVESVLLERARRGGGEGGSKNAE